MRVATISGGTAEDPALAEERTRLWEHGPGDNNFLHVRYGLCAQPLSLELIPPESAPVDQVDPAAASALHRLGYVGDLVNHTLSEIVTPLLDQPLSGSAYAVSGGGGLPRLAFILDGQVRLIPQAESTSVNDGQLRTTVPVIPDDTIRRLPCGRGSKSGRAGPR